MRRAATAILLLAAASAGGCRGDQRGFQAVGTLERDRLELIAEATEPIVSIRSREGERVEAGEVILELDPVRVEAEVEQARAARDRAAARFTELERGPRQEDIDAASARLTGAEGSLRSARLELDRARVLRTKGVEPESRLDAALAAYDEALAARDQAKALLAELRAGTRPEQIDQARAALVQAEKALAAVRIHFERLTLRAPRAGRVDSLPFELGERPPAGSVVAVLLADGAPYARVYVPEEIRAGVAPGSSATVWVDGVDGGFRGRVRTIASDPSFTPYYALTERDRGRLVYVAEVDLLDAEARDLPSGLPVQARFATPADAVAELERHDE
jgi:HlyD family secretion protein